MASMFCLFGANEMGEASAAVLAQVLVQNDTLTSINLSCNSLGAVSLRKALLPACAWPGLGPRPGQYTVWLC